MLRPTALAAVALILGAPGTALAEAPLGAITGTLGGVERIWHTRLDGPGGRPGSTAVERFALLHAASLEGYPADDGGDRLGVLSIRLSIAPAGDHVLAARVLYYPHSYGAFYLSPPYPGGVEVSLARDATLEKIAGRLTTTLCWQADPLSLRDESRCRELDIRFESDLPLAE